MSASDGIERGSTHAARLAHLRNNVAAYLALFARKPRSAVSSRGKFPILSTIVGGAVAVIVLTMSFVDAWSVSVALRLPPGLIAFFDHITDYGRSGWFLIPIGVMLMAIAAASMSSVPAMSQRVLAAIAVRLGFLFSAILLPGLIFTIIKRLIGRARPLVGGSVDPFLYLPFGWDVEYASLPSGHAVNAFAAATAIGLLWPKTLPLLWAYAVTIAVSRVVLTAHYPSDVLAGAIIAIASVLLIRNWFAARRLGFVAGADGRVRAMPVPSFARIKRVARQLIAP
ncbi:MAG TPA: phosphatase PAP2 family protein [Xanthobacteraceae bacterium]|jgi:undecaprenyl-diphosphatase